MKISMEQILLLAQVLTLVDASGKQQIWLPGASGSGPFEVAKGWATAFSALYPEADITLSNVGSGAAQGALWGEIDCENKPVQAICEQDDTDETVWGIGDAPFKSEDINNRPLLQIQQFPACAGAVAIVYSSEANGGSDKPIRMDFDVLGGIFNTTIAYWDDRSIQALNPDQVFPHERISVLVRSDSSGQTSIISDALDYQVVSWPDEAVGKLPEWPLGELVDPNEFTRTCRIGNVSDIPYSFAADGKSGIANGMLRLPYSIGYMEVGTISRLDGFLQAAEIGKANEPDSFVTATSDSVRVTMDGLAESLDEETFELNLARADTPIGGFPISGYAYWYLKGNSTAFEDCYQAWLLCKLIEWSYSDPQAAEIAESNGWVVPPESVAVKAIEKLNDVKCLNTEVDPPQIISALSYIPEPYRAEAEVNVVNIATITAAGFVVCVVLIWAYIGKQRKLDDNIWKVDEEELVFGDPAQVIGRGAFGLVLLAEYRGTQVAVKRVLPPNQKFKMKGGKASVVNPIFDHEGTELFAAPLKDGMEEPSKTCATDESSELDSPSGSQHRSSRPSSFHGRKPSFNETSSRFKSSVTTPTSQYKGTGSNGKNSSSSSGAVSRKEFIEEMRFLAKLRHPCIATVMGAVLNHRQEPMLVMEYMEHGSFHDILHNDTLVLDEDLLANILQDICQGIRFLHAAVPPVIHGDLKAKNILVDRKFRAKVADFGLSGNVIKGPCGTPYWMAPELLSGTSSNTVNSDIYAFGIIIYEALSRKDPYEGESMNSVLQEVMDPEINKRPILPKGVSANFQSIMRDCLEADPDLRPTAVELDSRLRRINTDKMDTSGHHKPLKAKGSNVSLFDIFPRHVAEALRDGRTVEPEHKDCVTVFFSDVVGFTDISSQLDPRKVADLLDRMYNALDDLASKYEVYKVETIGDAYMAVTNLVKDQPTDHAKRMAMFAMEAMDVTGKTIIDPENPEMGFVHLRVGFHSGPVVADVVGNRNPRYCLFGDTVNTASRMESSSQTNRIQCSKRTYELLRAQMPELPICPRGEIKVKGKGTMMTYWVNEQHTFANPNHRRPFDAKLSSTKEEPSRETRLRNKLLRLGSKGAAPRPSRPRTALTNWLRQEGMMPDNGDGDVNSVMS